MMVCKAMIQHEVDKRDVRRLKQKEGNFRSDAMTLALLEDYAPATEPSYVRDPDELCAF